MCAASDFRDGVDRSADDDASFADEHEFIAEGDALKRDYMAVLVGDLEVDDAHAPSSDSAVIIDWRALAVSFFCQGKDGSVGLWDDHVNDAVSCA